MAKVSAMTARTTAWPKVSGRLATEPIPAAEIIPWAMAVMLERRDTVEVLIQRIEKFEEEARSS